MAKSWVLDLPMLPMSMNERERAHWRVRLKEKNLIERDLAWLVQSQKVPKAKKIRSVGILLFKGARGKLDDPANRDSRSKSILDGLVHLGILIDDSEKWLDYRGVSQIVGDHAKTTRIVIEELDE